MSRWNKLFHGQFQIYLQGRNALLHFGELGTDQMTYFLGAKDSNILVRDYRTDSILAAHRVLLSDEDLDFADVFNSSSRVEILGRDENEAIEISLYPASEEMPLLVLWLGVIDDLHIPVIDSEWEILRPISLENVVFASIVRADNFVSGNRLTSPEQSYSLI